MVLCIAALLLAPADASAATTLPNSESLRAILPDPIDNTWIEVLPGTSGYIDGAVDYDVLRAYYTYYRQTDAFIQQAIDILRQGGFVGGYERQWVRPRSNDVLSEQVYVFATHSGASTMSTTSRTADAAAGAVQVFFDATLGPDATGMMETIGNATFTTVDFVRGNASYYVGIASAKPVKAETVIPQARLLYDRAPSNIALSQTPPASVLERNIWLFAIAGYTLLLGMAILVGVGTLALLLPQRRIVPRQGAPVRT